MKANIYVLEKYFNGLPQSTDFKIIEEELPPLLDGEFLAEAIYLSVDPYVRLLATKFQLGSTVPGHQVAKILESKSVEYPVGTYIVGSFGWRTHTVSNGKTNVTVSPGVWKVPNLDNFPLSLALGIIGIGGNTAYFGLLEICKPKSGETVVVSGAAGSVGNHVGQIAKLKCCKVIGITGTDEKGQWLVGELGFEHFINYKTTNVLSALKEYAPEGVDCYFDNVGGEISSAVISCMNKFGRISVCGCISVYNSTQQVLAPTIQVNLVALELKMEGFMVFRWNDRLQEGILQNLQWLKDGKLKYKETVTIGFENMFSAFVDMLQGKNIGWGTSTYGESRFTNFGNILIIE